MAASTGYSGCGFVVDPDSTKRRLSSGSSTPRARAALTAKRKDKLIRDVPLREHPFYDPWGLKMAARLNNQDLDLVLRHTRPLWEEARNRRFFLTGGTGFFGCWLVETFCHINQILELNASITILSRDPKAFAAKCPHLVIDRAVSLHAGDVRTFDFPIGQFDYTIHAATEARARLLADEPLEMLSTIIEGTERVLDFASTHQTAKFLLTSSGAVYGPQPQEITHVSEEYSGAPIHLNPAHLYGEGKRVSELQCATFQNQTGIEFKIARCWAFCGPHLPLNEHFAIGNFIGDALAGRPIEIQGDGTPRRSYLYAADLAVWLWTILFRAPALQPFNVGSANDISILELARTVAAVVNPKSEVRVARAAQPGVQPARYVPNVDRARALLGLAETIGLEESIRRTAAWNQQR
jgi:nucleoside-diphosphate-sugar epimerase